MWVDLKGKDSVPETVHHLVLPVDPTSDMSWSRQNPIPHTDEVHKNDKVDVNNNSPESHSEAIKRLKPLKLKELLDALDCSQCLIFCRTNLDCDNLEAYLTALGGGRGFRGKVEKGVENPYSCVVMAGMRGNDERRENLQAFKDGDVRFLVCTDVAARGIDIKGLPYCINLCLPDKDEDYLHRVGRVGRADHMGLAISLVATQKEKVWYYDKKKWAKKELSTKLADQGGCCIWYDEPLPNTLQRPL